MNISVSSVRLKQQRRNPPALLQRCGAAVDNIPGKGSAASGSVRGVEPAPQTHGECSMKVDFGACAPEGTDVAAAAVGYSRPLTVTDAIDMYVYQSASVPRSAEWYTWPHRWCRCR